MKMELESTWLRSRRAPVISSKFVVQFLCLVQLNTAVRLKSEAFAYSTLHNERVKYLAIPHHAECFYSDSGTEESDEEQVLLNSLLIQDSHSGRDKKYSMRCWIITHPTSSVYLTDMEIVQLHKLTKKKEDCFCVVLSPRNAGMKMLCVKLTKRGYSEMNEMEGSMGDDESLTEEKKFEILANRIHESASRFYNQIPCHLCDDPCIYCDNRDISIVLDRIKQSILSDSSVLW